MVRLFRRSRPEEEEQTTRAATDRALSQTRSSWFGKIGGLLRGTDITPETWDSLEEVLIGADAGVATTMEVLDRVRDQKPQNLEALRAALRDELVAILRQPEPRGRLWGDDGEELEIPSTPAVVLIVGVNGTGKTTTLARLAHRYQQHEVTVLAAAADTFRAAAIEQLRGWGERLDFPVIAQQQGSDPAAVVFDAVESAMSREAGVLLVDTAGRLHNKQNLMDELTKIRRVIDRHLKREPDEVALVLDATTGQNGLAQARAFTEAVEVTSVILTKLDGTAKGGIVFAVASELGLPVRFIGTGESPDDLAPFSPETFVDALLGAEAGAAAEA